MKEFIYRDIAGTVASGEICNLITIHAVNPIAADAVLRRLYSLNRLDKFGRVNFLTATWTNTTKTLTLTGAFARYLLANSTRIIIVSGTGVVAGEYVIATRTSDNAITLTADIAITPGDLSGGDIVGYIIGGRTATRYERTKDTTLDGLPDASYGGTIVNGQLTTRTDADTGTITVPTGHGLNDGDLVDLFWFNGSRSRAAISSSAATTVVVGASTVGVGDNLPLVNTLIDISRTLARGVAPSRMIPGLVNEVTVTAA